MDGLITEQRLLSSSLRLPDLPRQSEIKLSLGGLCLVSVETGTERENLILANGYYDLKEFDRAVEAYKKIISEEKNGPIDLKDLAEAQFFLGRSLMELEKFDEAHNTFKTFVNDKRFAENTLLSEAGFRLAECSYRLSSWKQAEGEFQSFVKAKPADEKKITPEYQPWAGTYLGDCQFNQKKFDEAEKSYQLALKQNKSGSSAEYATLGLARALAEQKEYAKAIDALTELSKGSGATAIQAKIYSGIYQYLGGSPDRAVEILNGLLKESSQLTAAQLKEVRAFIELSQNEALFSGASAKYQQGKYAEAQLAFETYLKVAPADTARSAKAQEMEFFLKVRQGFLQGMASENEGKPDRALSEFTSLRAVIGESRKLIKSAEVVSALAAYDLSAGRRVLISLENSNKSKDADKVYQELRKIYPQESLDGVLYSLAQKHYSAASKLSREPEQLALAKTLDARATELFSRLLTDFPTSSQAEHARAGLIQLACTSSNWAEVEQHAKELLKNTPKSSHAIFAQVSLGLSQLRRGSYVAAETTFAGTLKSLQSEPMTILDQWTPTIKGYSGEVQLGQARELQKQGKISEAMTEFLKVKILYPNYPELVQAAEKQIAELKKSADK